MAYYNNDDSGCSCGCIILFLIMAGIGWRVEKCSDDSQQNNDTTTNSVINTTKTDETFQVETESLSEEDAPYSDNHLMTGDTPYKLYYGDNYCCKYPQCSGIEVTAPISSDIVVIIKRNNQNGKVISHAYICAGKTYTFDLPNGTFQPFFYYGEGWNPNKEMPSGVKGGFVRYESFSKDEPQNIHNCVIQYVLQLQRNGNFQTEHSNANELF